MIDIKYNVADTTKPNPIYYQSYICTRYDFKIFVEEWWRQQYNGYRCIAFKERMLY